MSTNLTQNILVTPLIVAGIILMAVAGFAIGSNYQGNIHLALTKEGVNLKIQSCQR